MAFCSSCGETIAENTAFCAKCGKPAGQTMGGGPSAATAPAANAGLQDNVASALSYIFIVAIIFLLIEPYNRNRTVRFHCFQSLGLAVASIVVHIGLMFIPYVGWVISPLFSLAVFVVWVICLVKAFQGQQFKLPIIGDWAEKTANS